MDKYKAIVNIPAWARELTAETDKVTGADSAYRHVPLVYRAVKLLSESLASIPVKVMKGEKEVDWPMITQVDEIVRNIETSLLVSGNAYCEIARNSLTVKDLVSINPLTMRVDYNNGVYTFTQNTGGKSAVWHNVPGENKYEMLYIHEYNPNDDTGNGISPTHVSLTDAQLLRYMERYAARYFEGGAMPITLLGIEDAISDEERERVQGFFKRAATGIANAFKVIALRGEIKPQIITQPMKDLAMPELYEQAKRNICHAFGIPQTMLDDAANYATAAEHTLQFWGSTVKPRGRKIESAINHQVFGQLKSKIVMQFGFDELEVFQEDEANRSTSLQALVNAGMPLLVAAEILGYDFTDEQLAMLAVPVEVQEVVPVRSDLRKWEKFAINGLGKSRRKFEAEGIPASMYAAIDGALEVATTQDDVKRIFADASKHENYWSLY